MSALPDDGEILWGVLALDGETNRIIYPEDQHRFVGPVCEPSQTRLSFTCVGTDLKIVRATPDGRRTEERTRRLWLSRKFVAPELCETSGVFDQPSFLDLPTELDADAFERHPRSRVAAVCATEPPMPCMDAHECEELVRYVCDVCAQSPHVKLLTFNGVSFDMRLLSYWCTDPDLKNCCVSLTMDSVDPCFQMLCERGFPVGLQAMCAGAGLPGKSGSGCTAPEDFASACPSRVAAMFAYCMNDVDATLALYEECLRTLSIAWITKKDKVSTHKLLYVRDYGIPHMASVGALLLTPYPDMTWSYPKPSEPGDDDKELLPTRWKFVSWMFSEAE